MEKIFIIIACLVMNLTPLVYEKAGTTINHLLNLGGSARAIGMGNVLSTVPGELDQIYYNPAGTVSEDLYEASLMQTFYAGGFKIINFANRLNAGNAGNFGLAFSTLLINQQNTTVYSAEPGGTVDLKGNLFYGIVHYSKLINDHFAAGGNIKIITENLSYGSVNGHLALDLGVLGGLSLFKEEKKQLTFSLVVNNLGVPEKAAVSDFKTPITIRSGVGYLINMGEKNTLRVQLEYEKNIEKASRLNFGLEYLLLNMIYFRAGYRIGEGINGFKFGTGFHIKSFKIDYALDYGNIGYNNRIELGVVINRKDR